MPVTTWNYQTKEYDTAYAGCVLTTGFRSTRIMSDVWGTELYAYVWDEVNGRIAYVNIDVYEWERREESAKNTAVVDATPEVREAARKYLYKLAYEEEAARQQAANEQIVKGCQVEVVAGRKGKGTKGRVEIMILRPYNQGWRSTAEYKLGIPTSDVMVDYAAPNGKVYKNYRDITWVWARNCKRIDTPEVDRNVCQEVAARAAEREMAIRYKAS